MLDARALIPLLDLTRLDGARDADIAAFVRRAVTPYGNVAALVVWPELVGKACALRPEPTIRVATVAGFPEGPCDPGAQADACRSAIADGADEVDMVFPYRAWQAGDAVGPRETVEACRAACGERTLKVILETAAFDDAASLRRAADVALAAGADFLKTSTGKGSGGATIEAARVLVDVIAASGRDDVGFKASGGIRTYDACLPYAVLVADRLGVVDANRLRFGASGLLDDLLVRAEVS